MTRKEQERIEKFILQKLAGGNMHWGDLLKITLASCDPSATLGRFNGRLKYLLEKEYIKRLAHGIYGITEKGRQYKDIV